MQRPAPFLVSPTDFLNRPPPPELAAFFIGGHQAVSLCCVAKVPCPRIHAHVSPIGAQNRSSAAPILFPGLGDPRLLRILLMLSHALLAYLPSEGKTKLNRTGKEYPSKEFWHSFFFFPWNERPLVISPTPPPVPKPPEQETMLENHTNLQTQHSGPEFASARKTSGGGEPVVEGFPLIQMCQWHRRFLVSREGEVNEKKIFCGRAGPGGAPEAVFVLRPSLHNKGGRS